MDEPKNDGGMGDSEQPDRPLGRGLEDLSYLFKSSLGGVRREPATPPRTEATGAREAPRSRPPSTPAVLRRPQTTIDRALLGGALRDFLAGAQEGLQVIDESLPCPPCGEIDLLALDRDRRLAIVDFATTADDGLLVRGASQADWLARNQPIVNRMYAGRNLNFSGSPRVFLVAPSFSAAFRHAAQRIPQVICTRYVAVQTGDAIGILFEAVTEP
jgi:hypothetical protein